MTDGGAAFEPGRGEPPFRPRGAYVGHEVFGHGDGAVLVDPEVARDLRSAAESASQERRIAGGLLYGRMLADDEGRYLVIDGFLEAGPGENPGDRISREGRDSFTLSDADLGCCARTPPGCTRPHLRWAGGGRSRVKGSSASETSRRSASLSGPAAPACSYSGKDSNGAPPTWDRTGGSRTRPGHSSRSRGPPPRRRSCRRGSLAWCLAPCLNQTGTLSRTRAT